MEISEKALAEKGGARPPYWNMVFWWTRKPLITARAVIAASIIPENKISIDAFKKDILRLDVNTPHRENPDFKNLPEIKELFQKTKLLDPFAGFGSIPLEAIRLNVGEVKAVELLPTAVIFLKAILEYPLKANRDPRWRNLVEDVKKYGEEIIQKLRNDPDIKELYDEDIAVYIGTWEVKCPNCGRYTPLIGNYWLARVKSNNNYTRLVYMQPQKKDDEITIEVVDVNKKYRINSLNQNKLSSNTIDLTHIQPNLKLKVPEKNIDAQRNTAVCLHCGNTIRYIHPETKQHYTDKKNLLSSIKKKLEFYPKYALKQWNQLLEKYLNGEINLEQLKQAPARPRILVKVKIKDRDLEFQPATNEDQEKLWKALQKLKQYWKDPDIPTEPIPKYENRRITPILGVKYWYQFFNPRQLLTLIKLVKLIRETGKDVIQQKQEQGWDPKETKKYAEAITTYLSIMLCKYVDFNSVSTRWNPGWLKFEESLSVRGIAMMWSWSDSSPFAPLTGTWTRNLENTINGLNYLISKLRKSSNIEISMDDATILNSINNNKFNIIATDPPYRDDIPYTELSDFYFVWLKRALSDNDGFRLLPLFHENLLFRRVGAVQRPISTQWEFFAMREVSFNPGRYRERIKDANEAKAYAYQRYLELLAGSFRSLSDHLVEDGLVITYYNHTDPDAWRDLLWAGWAIAGLKVTATWPLDTENKKSIIKYGKRSLDTSLIVVWRRRIGETNDLRIGIAGEVYREALDAARQYAKSVWEHHKGLDAFIGVMGKVLEVVTSYDRIVFPERPGLGRYLGKTADEENDLVVTGRVVRELVFPVAARALIDYLIGSSTYNVSSPISLFYLLFKIVFLRDPGTTRKLMGKEKKLDSSSMTIISIASGIDIDEMVRKRIVLEKRVKGESKKVEYILNAPLSTSPGELKAFLENRRGINPDRPRITNSIDALHVLEYYAVKFDRAGFNRMLSRLLEQPGAPSYIDEAKGIAYITCKYFEGDPEQELARRMLDYMGIRCDSGEVRHSTLDRYFSSRK